MFSQRFNFTLLAVLASFNIQVSAGGNSGGGGSPEKVDAGAIKLLIQSDGLKKAMVNYLSTIQIPQVDDAIVRTELTKMMSKNALIDDVRNSNYILSTPSAPCKDAYDKDVPAATTVGALASNVCFDLDKLVQSLHGFSEEDVMVQLASLAFHEHVHHFQKFSDKAVQSNEAAANRVAGYILITAKFVQLPLLHWIRPGSGPAAFQSIQSLYTEIRAREQAFIAPTPADYANYPNYLGKKDRGVVRLLPQEKYDDKISIRGGGAYYSFTRLSHEYGYASDISLRNQELSVGFAGCDLGWFVRLGNVDLESVSDRTSGLQYLINFKPANTEPKIRIQQGVWDDHQNGFEYSRRILNPQVGETFALRSVNFDESDILVAFRILRFDEDGSILLAWKKLRSFPVQSCR